VFYIPNHCNLLLLITKLPGSSPSDSMSCVFLCLYQRGGWSLVCPDHCYHGVLKSLKSWTYFHQTCGIGASWDMDERVEFCGQRLNFEVTMMSNMPEMHFLASLMWYLENYWTEFRHTFSFDALWDEDECVKGQRSRSQHDQWPSERRHTELVAVHELTSSLSLFQTKAHYSKVDWLNKDQN